MSDYSPAFKVTVGKPHIDSESYTLDPLQDAPETFSNMPTPTPVNPETKAAWLARVKREDRPVQNDPYGNTLLNVAFSPVGAGAARLVGLGGRAAAKTAGKMGTEAAEGLIKKQSLNAKDLGRMSLDEIRAYFNEAAPAVKKAVGDWGGLPDAAPQVARIPGKISQYSGPTEELLGFNAPTRAMNAPAVQAAKDATTGQMGHKISVAGVEVPHTAEFFSYLANAMEGLK